MQKDAARSTHFLCRSKLSRIFCPFRRHWVPRSGMVSSNSALQWKVTLSPFFASVFVGNTSNLVAPGRETEEQRVVSSPYTFPQDLDETGFSQLGLDILSHLCGVAFPTVLQCGLRSSRYTQLSRPLQDVWMPEVEYHPHPHPKNSPIPTPMN